MNTKLFAGLALAAALLAGGPAFASDSRGGGGGGGSGRAVAAFTSGGSRGVSSGAVAGRAFRSSGGAYYSRAYAGGGGGTYAFGSRPGWNPGSEYSWHGHYYRWYNNGWFIVDPYYADYPYYYDNGPGYTVYGSPDTDNGPASVQVEVQQELARMGYYQGPIDGVIGPGTQAAISAYQRDNGLRVTGTINGRLLDALDLN
jgi:hypothetical protein